MFEQSSFLAAHHIDARVWEFLTLCATDKIDARLVGGCVRDALLATAKQAHLADIDIAINIPPSAVIAFCTKHRFKYFPTGIAHGTLTILFKGLTFEVTSLRADIDTFGRHATVTFGASFEEDARRRDFTFNALFVDHQKILYDAFHGVSDLHNGYVRFIGDSATRIAEDYLRLYRYFRFWGRFGKGAVDISVLPPLNTIKEAIRHLSIERVQSELFKILTLSWPGKTLESMAFYGLLNHVFPFSSDYTGGIAALRRLVILERFGQHPPCAIRHLCALTQNQNLLHIFKFSRFQKKKFSALSKSITDTDYEIALAHPEWWVDSMLVRKALLPCVIWACRAQSKALTPPPPFPLTGEDIMAIGITGAQIGETLNAVKRDWIASGFTLDRKSCLACVK